MITKLFMKNYVLKIAFGKRIMLCFVKRNFIDMLLIFLLHPLYLNNSLCYSVSLTFSGRPFFICVLFHLNCMDLLYSLLYHCENQLLFYMVFSIFSILFYKLCRNECHRHQSQRTVFLVVPFHTAAFNAFLKFT